MAGSTIVMLVALGGLGIRLVMLTFEIAVYLEVSRGVKGVKMPAEIIALLVALGCVGLLILGYYLSTRL